MSGFIRRYQYFPGREQIRQIEGVVIIDTPPPGRIEGVQSGVVCLIGEYADVSYAVTVESDGDVVANLNPVDVFTAQDLLDKCGGFDETLGEFGGDFGNAFCSLRNKRFARLIICPIDNVTPTSGTNKGIRICRDLPTNKTATDPTPIVPVAAGVIAAGREFKSGANRVRAMQRTVFADDPAYKSAIDGAVTAAGAAVTQTFTSATGDFVNEGVREGDILVLGVIGASGAQGANAATYRVVSVTNATDLVVEKLNGASFNWTTGTALAYRLHVGATADSSGVAGRTHQFSENGGYTVPARPLDATVAVSTLLTPTVVPEAGTANSWDVLSGLFAAVSPGAALTYSADIHAPNAANNAAMLARYENALDAIMADREPTRDINIVWIARKPNATFGATLVAKLKSHVGTASERGLTRRAIYSPALDVLSTNTALGSSVPGVGGTRAERIDYSWPPLRHSVPEAVGFSLATSDGSTTTDGVLDDPADGWLVSLESNLPPERNPGQAAEPVPTLMAPVLSYARGVPVLSQAEFIQFRQNGICAVRFDRVSGPIFQSGITTSLTSGEKNINRRRMADFIQDSIADRINQFSKLPLTQTLKDSVVAEIDAFLSDLVSANNPEASRINAYQIDDVNGNTPDLEAAGVFVVIVRVRLTPTADFIVLQTSISENTVIVETL